MPSLVAIQMAFIAAGDKELARLWLQVTAQKLLKGALTAEEQKTLAFVLQSHMEDASHFWLGGKKPHVSRKTSEHIKVFLAVEAVRKEHPHWDKDQALDKAMRDYPGWLPERYSVSKHEEYSRLFASYFERGRRAHKRLLDNWLKTDALVKALRGELPKA